MFVSLFLGEKSRIILKRNLMWPLNQNHSSIIQYLGGKKTPRTYARIDFCYQRYLQPMASLCDINLIDILGYLHREIIYGYINVLLNNDSTLLKPNANTANSVTLSCVFSK